MSRHPTVPKTIQGKPATQKEFKAAIVEAIRVRGAVKPRDVLVDLGEEWQTPEGGKLVGQIFSAMTNSDLLIRDDDGLYRVSYGYDRRAGSDMGTAIVAFVRAQGGIVYAYEILDMQGARAGKAFNLKNGADAQETSEHRRTFRFLKETTKLVNYYEDPGVWGLPRDELLACPLGGSWVRYFTKRGYYATTPPHLFHANSDVDAEKEVLHKFKEIGWACTVMRDQQEMSIAQLLEVPAINALFVDMKRSSKGGDVQRQVNYNMDWEASFLASQVKVDGDCDRETIMKERDALVPQELEHIVAAFEKGNWFCHMHTTSHFFQTLADHFGYCPAMLSRGFPWVNPPDARAESAKYFPIFGNGPGARRPS